MGDTLTYTFTITNTGTLTLHGLGLVEDNFTGTGNLSALNCGTGDLNADLAPGATITCTATYTTTQADVDAGKIDNTATITATDPAGNPTTGTGTATTDSTGTPSVALDKSVSATSYSVGDTLTYTFTITNTGTLTLGDLGLVEDSFTGTGNLSALNCGTGDLNADLAPGATITCTATYVATQADVDAGHIDNTATITATDPAGNPTTGTDDATTDSAGTSSIELNKTINAAEYGLGDTLTYSFEITNTGDLTLDGLSLSEDDFTGTGSLSALNCTPAALTDALAPGATITCTASYVTTQADVDAGQIDNTATIRGSDLNGANPTSDTDSANVGSNGTSDIQLTKAVDATSYSLGDTLTYTFTIQNTGTLTLGDLSLNEDSFTGTGTLSGVDCGADDLADDLAPGATITCTATYVTTQADVDAGKIDNAATITGTDPSGTNRSDSGTATTTSAGASGVKLTKTVDASNYGLGDTLTYTFAIENTGTLTLRGLTLDDTNFSGTGTLSALDCGTDDLAANLAPGASITCTATYVATQADVDAGKIDNSATITGTDLNGTNPTSDTDDATTDSTGTSSMKLTKSVDAAEYGVGDTLTYTFTITNTGTLTLRGITLDDSNFSGTGTLSALNCGTGDLNADLAPGAVLTCTASYVTTQADVDAGQIDNSASVTATGVTGGHPTDDTDDATTKSSGTSSVALDKAVSATSYSVGDTLTYTFTITNTGTLTLHDLTIDDSNFSGTGNLSALDCAGTDLAAALAPGGTITCTATYVATQADVDAGKIDNTASVTATDPTGTDRTGTDTATTDSTGTASVALDKSVSATSYSVGDTLTYTFTITNTGTLTLHGLGLVEDNFTGTGNLSALNCGTGDLNADLAPGAVLTCTATYVATQADVDAGQIDNTATITATDPAGNPTTGTDDATTDSTGTASVALDKSVSATSYSVGDTLTYTFTITNTGTLTLHDLSIDDSNFTGTGNLSALDCGTGDLAADLAPGATITLRFTPNRGGFLFRPLLG